jgi:branched-subunit amino acid ABC-type transport system permease component
MTQIPSLLAFGVVDGALLSISSVAFTMQFGVTNLVNFAFGEFITFGAFSTYSVDRHLHISFPEALLVGGVASALLAYIVGHFLYAPFFRRRPQVLFGLVMTFGASLVLGNVWLAIWGANFYQLPYFQGTPKTYHVWQVAITQLDIIIVGISVVGLILVHGLLRYTKLGRAMRAMADDSQLARTCGLRVGRITDVTWLITGFLAGAAGVVQAVQVRGFDATLGDTYVYVIFAAAVLGGVGRPYGAMLGAIIVGIFTQLSVPVLGSTVSPVVVFGILVLVMLLRPQGLFGGTGRSAFSGEG